MLFESIAIVPPFTSVSNADITTMFLLNPIDGSRPHSITETIRWHARFMSLGWSFFFPVAIVIARFYKVTPKQNFPEEIDNQWWWISHRVLVTLGVIAVAIAFYLVYFVSDGDVSVSALHKYTGWAALLMLVCQIGSGLLRGTRGGPPAPYHQGSLRGDHYDMTLRRIIFEYAHKSIGYVALGCAWIATVAGLWSVNAPVWIWILVVGWWLAIGALSLSLQKQHRAIDTYQAIWGTNPALKGNQIRSIGIGVHRVKHQDNQ